MVVHFYEIRSCTYTNVESPPALAAPEDLLLDILTYFEFVLLEDGAAQLAALILLDHTQTHYRYNKYSKILKEIFIMELILIVFFPVIHFFVECCVSCDDVLHM